MNRRVAKKIVKRFRDNPRGLGRAGTYHIELIETAHRLVGQGLAGESREAYLEEVLKGREAAAVAAEPSPAEEAPVPREADGGERAPKRPAVKRGSAPDTSSMTVEELRALAKQAGLKGYSKLKKAELIAALSDS
jgi:hypothetical protein